jgi:hypothetical protein
MIEALLNFFIHLLKLFQKKRGFGPLIVRNYFVRIGSCNISLPILGVTLARNARYYPTTLR